MIRKLGSPYRRVFTANAPVVLWGSLHGFQYRSKADVLRARVLWAEWRTYGQMAKQMKRNMRLMGMTFREAAEGMKRAADALRKFGEST